MPTTVENVHLLDAMATIIGNVLSSAPIPVQVWGRRISSPGSYPCVDMYPADTPRGEEAAGFGGRGEFFFTVRVRAQTNDADANQDLLLNMMDDINAYSVPMALLDQPTLGGIASSVDIQDDTGLVVYGLGADDPIGFQFTARVIRAES